MALAYESITSQTLSASAASVSFTSIPASWTDLILVASYRDTRTGSLQGYPPLRLNNDSGNNYSATRFWTSVTENGSNRAAIISSMLLAETAADSSPANQYTYAVAELNGYSNTNFQKTVILQGVNPRGNGGFNRYQAVSTWRNTAAINRIDILGDPNSGGIASGSSFALYGIKNA